MKEKEKPAIKNSFKNDDALDLDNFQVSSTTDCTGLMPRPPQSEAEMEAYEDLYQFLPPVVEIEEEPSDPTHS